MPSAEAQFLDFASQANIRPGQFFGFPALKQGGKTLALRDGKYFVFRLSDADRDEALLLPEASAWNPFGKAKRNWIRLGPAHEDKWPKYFAKALQNL
jgi:hypothetical protein